MIGEGHVIEEWVSFSFLTFIKNTSKSYVDVDVDVDIDFDLTERTKGKISR